MNSYKKKLARERKRKSRMFLKELKNDMQNILKEMYTQDKNTASGEGTSKDIASDANNDKSNTEIKDVLNQEFSSDSESGIQYENVLLRRNSSVIDFNEPSTSTSAEITELREWAVNNYISHKNLDQLLGILRKRLFPDLPKTAKTFLGTSLAMYNIRIMENCSMDKEPGQFVYFGIAQGLEKCLADFHKGDINLIINIDGLPLSKSGKTGFWPILCKIFYDPDVYEPFEVAIYSGPSKPKKLDDYFQDFIKELNDLYEKGFRSNEKIFKVYLKAIVADTPARSFCKGTKGHGGYSACERCTVYGKAIKVGKKNKTQIVYPGVDHPKRTNMSFRERMDPEHHIAISPLELIQPEIEMISIFPLDFMHLVCLGATKKILEFLLTGSLKVRINLRNRQELSRRMLSLKAQMPKEFQRKSRAVNYFPKWKATEFKFFLLYCGPIVLKNLISRQLYNHFLLLHTSFRILCNETLISCYKEKARRYLKIFVLSLPILYGEQAQVINMHNLCHIVDDVNNFGCDLSKINCFPFENHFRKIKNLIRTPNQPLAQFCRRQHEKSILSCKPIEIPSRLQIEYKSLKEGEIIVKTLKLNSTIISSNMPDNVVLLNNGYVAKIKNIFGYNESQDSLFIEAKVWKTKTDVFTYPTQSRKVHVWKIETKTSVDVVYPIINIEQKLVALKLSNQPNGRVHTYALALLHV